MCTSTRLLAAIGLRRRAAADVGARLMSATVAFNTAVTTTLSAA